MCNWHCCFYLYKFTDIWHPYFQMNVHQDLVPTITSVLARTTVTCAYLQVSSTQRVFLQQSASFTLFVLFVACLISSLSSISVLSCVVSGLHTLCDVLCLVYITVCAVLCLVYILCVLCYVWCTYCVSCVMSGLHTVCPVLCLVYILCVLCYVWSTYCVFCVMSGLHIVCPVLCLVYILCVLCYVWSTYSVRCVVSGLHTLCVVSGLHTVSCLYLQNVMSAWTCHVPRTSSASTPGVASTASQHWLVSIANSTAKTYVFINNSVPVLLLQPTLHLGKFCFREVHPVHPVTLNLLSITC